MNNQIDMKKLAENLRVGGPSARLTKLMRVHGEEGLRRYGVERWDKANLGWVIDGDFLIASKVYGDPTVVFQSQYEYEDDDDEDTIEHTESIY